MRKHRLRDSRRIELIDERVAASLRGKLPEQRVAMVFDANRAARLLIAGAIRTQHPLWSKQQVAREVARRMLGTD